MRIDGFSRRPDSQPAVPDFLFFGSEREEGLSADYGDRKFKKVRVRGLIHTLSRYRFTIEENTPIEQEVALDPELSGKVFENLLAAYNPETGATARKQTGSFYTPREIVDYMVDEALIAFLKGGLPAEDEKVTEEKLRRLASWEESGHDFDEEETKSLIAAIDALKALDPAVGSGAFPMGILHKLVFILGKLDPYNKQWEQRQIQRVRDAVAMAEKIEDAAIRERTVRELEQQIVGIEEAFERNGLDYGRKLYLIENCLYGVDIQPIAVQIAKMRFFISLIVDQRVDPDAPNLGVRPLPNLETKFVAANTLIGIEKPKQGAFRNPDIDAKEAELRKVRERHFNAKTPGNKAKYRELDKKLRSEAAQLLKRDGWGDTTAKQLAAWDPYDQNASAPFFDPEWMFGVQKGFAVVIGNPPYIQIQSFSGRPEQKAWEQQNYVAYAKTGDVYGLFYEKGFGLLAAGGVLAYITSNKWMRANYGAKLRDFFASQTAPQTLIDFGSYQGFDASTVDTNILVLVKQPSAGNGRPLQAVRIEKDFAADTDIPGYVKSKAIELKDLSSESWIISSLAEYDIRKRIEIIGVPLKEWDISINYGIKTGFNEAFIIDGRKKDELIARDPQSAEIIKPILRRQDIKRYKADFADLWLVNTHNGYGNVQRVDVKKDYRAVWEYLDSVNRETHNKVANRQDQGGHWSNLRNCAYVGEFDKEKIVWGNLALSAQFALAKAGLYINAPSTMITPASRYLLAVLNSSVGDYYIRSFGVSRSGGYFEYKPMFVENLPIPKLDPAARLPFEILGECVLFARGKGLDAEADLLESVIDSMVYDLYFGDDMRKAGCYVTGRIAEAARPFKADDADSFKKDYVRTLYRFCQKDETIYHGLIHRRTVEAVRMITGEKI
ncbi:MAG: hypothetical protein AUK26_10235 [Syntrophaceae bacterium CG2_30_58_14]|nr:MAG: hypothetical protein AUK26_10235 [Syntrophaceae bacterium CG2_30_58_14]